MRRCLAVVTWPVRRLGRALEVHVTRSFERERRGPSRLRVITAALLFLVVLVGPIVVGMLDPMPSRRGWYGLADTLLYMGLAFCAGSGILTLTGVIRAQAWRRGYRAGRDSFIASMGEARRRGLHEIEWMVGEAQRDGVPCGVLYDALDAPIGMWVIDADGKRREIPAHDV